MRMVKCTNCGGKGVIGKDTWSVRTCTVCRGLGKVAAVTHDQLRR